MKFLRATVLAAALLILTGCGTLVCSLALRPPGNLSGKNLKPVKKMMEGRYPGINAWYDSLRVEGVFKDTLIVGEGGYRIHAVYAGKPDASGSVILIHGYTVNHMGMMHFARLYRDSFNFNVILPDLQFQGQSEGEAIHMGWQDRLDARRWVELSHSLWNSDFVMVHGVSLGAATTMMLSGEPDLPPYLRCFVEDCGYTSAWDEFDFLRHRFLVSEEGLENGRQWVLKRYGWDFKEASALNQVAKCDRPMLFIHGNPDNFVPTQFLDTLYEAKTSGYKEKWISEGTPKHAVAYLTNSDDYTERLKNFINKVYQLYSIPRSLP